MKLNNGKGWEPISKHSSPNQYHGPHVSGAGDNRGQNTNSRGPSQAQLTAQRLNAPQPLPPSPAMQMGKKRERPNVPNAQLQKRPSGAAGGLQPGVSTPAASTQAQFQNSQTNLPPAHTKSSQAMPQQLPQTPRNQEPKKTTWQKITSALCCGMSRHQGTSLLDGSANLLGLLG